MRIALGEVRQARKGHAIAAKATAVKVAITQDAAPADRTKDGYADKPRSTVTLALGFGLLEAAAVAPATTASGENDVSRSGAGGGLPITGPRLDIAAAAGVGLLALGAAALLFTARRRRTRN